MSGILEQLLAAITLNNELLQQQAGGAAAPAGNKPQTAAEKKAAADAAKKAAEKKGPAHSVAETTALVTEIKERLGADKAREALKVGTTQLKLNQLTDENSDTVFDQATAILEAAEEDDV